MMMSASRLGGGGSVGQGDCRLEFVLKLSGELRESETQNVGVVFFNWRTPSYTLVNRLGRKHNRNTSVLIF